MYVIEFRIIEAYLPDERGVWSSKFAGMGQAKRQKESVFHLFFKPYYMETTF